MNDQYTYPRSPSPHLSLSMRSAVVVNVYICIASVYRETRKILEMSNDI
jgi:hypothetical protein